MKLRALRYLQITAREGDLTRAADLLLVSQPTLSRPLTQSEDGLGVTLFEPGKGEVPLATEDISRSSAAHRRSWGLRTKRWGSTGPVVAIGTEDPNGILVSQDQNRRERM